MKFASKNTMNHPTNRISALKRLSKPTSTNNNHYHRLSTLTRPTIIDARQLLANRKQPIFDARQLLSRQSSKANDNNSLRMQHEDDNKSQSRMISKFNNIQSTSRLSDRSFQNNTNASISLYNSNSNGSISLTKTITNSSFRHKNDKHQLETFYNQASSYDQKFVISFVNDQCHKRPRSLSPSPSSSRPIIKRLHDASIQTARSSTRVSSHGQHDDERNAYNKLPIKNHSSRHATIKKEQSAVSKASVKQKSSDISLSTRLKQNSSRELNTSHSKIFISNLKSSVTEDDIYELFSQIGCINKIIPLSHDCIQLVYSKREYAEQAVAQYHNRLFDGQLIYVSFQQPSTYPRKSSKISSMPTKNSNSSSSSLRTYSNKIPIDPKFIRETLFNSSNNSTNDVQFQITL